MLIVCCFFVVSVGMFDYRDLVSYILVVFKKNEWKEEEDVGIREIVKRALRSEPVSVLSHL